VTRVVIVGTSGFIGQNLRLQVQERTQSVVVPVTRDTSREARSEAFASADIVVHLAGVNRPKDVAEFTTGNAELTAAICDELHASGRATPLVYASSIQADLDNAYGRSKRAAEQAVAEYGAKTGAGVAILRLPNVFGKWCRPNYNSVVATFCHNIARGVPITVSDPASTVRLVHVDDVVDQILAYVRSGVGSSGRVDVAPVYETTVGTLSDLIRGFAESRQSLDLERVGTGFLRALYATYVSYLPPDGFSYRLTKHEDPRGVFAELLRTKDSGQFSFFSAHPGVTRGGHYHHTKTEKFLVVKGTARFGFRHVVTGERVDVVVDGVEARVVETVPGWVHDITNVGDDDIFVLLWANEVFDPQVPDTIAARVTE
jgi:UDP-2-acetamido-2,6-beta-L-arabino-hexul-4-ose reductase